jgi:hypothetical protein
MRLRSASSHWRRGEEKKKGVIENDSTLVSASRFGGLRRIDLLGSAAADEEQIAR